MACSISERGVWLWQDLEGYNLESAGYPSESSEEEEEYEKLGELDLDEEDPERMFIDGTVMADSTGKMSVISMMHRICWGGELETDEEAKQFDGSGRYSYLMACRSLGARPVIPALMMMSGQSLLLHNYGLQAVDARAIAAGLADNTTLTDVNVSDNALGEGCGDIYKMLEANKTLRKFNMKQIAMGWKGGEHVGQMLRANSNLTQLELRSNKIGDRSCATIFAALTHNKALKHLDLGDNQLGKQAVHACAAMLAENATLTYLDLSWNHIRPQELKVLCPAIADNGFIRAVSLAWNGIGGDDTASASSPPKPAAKGGGPTTGGAALVDLMKRTMSLTELDVSNCRLGSKLCGELAAALKNNKTLQHVMLDGNPLGVEAMEVLKNLNARLAEGSIKRFSMDNCYYDPLMRVIEYEADNPSGYYRLDLADPKDRETVGKLIDEANKTKRNMLRNERLNGQRFSLQTKGAEAWKAPAEGILELDVIVTEPCEPGTDAMDSEDFRFLGRVMEMSQNGDMGRMHILKQACRAHYLDISQALTLLFKFGLGSSRESAVVLMFGHLKDRSNLFVLNAALDLRSREVLQKRVGPLHIMSKGDPAGRYHFDLTKSDDVRALRLLLQLKKMDPTAKVSDVLYCREVWDKPVLISPESEVWGRLFPTSGAGMGQAETLLDRGLLELEYDCERPSSKTLKTAMNKMVRNNRADASDKRKATPLLNIPSNEADAEVLELQVHVSANTFRPSRGRAQPKDDPRKSGTSASLTSAMRQ